MKKHFVLTLFCASFLLCSGQEHLREYPFTRTAKLQKTPGVSASIKFDPCLYKNTNEDYSNLRILDQEGNTVPYAVRVSAPLIKTTEYEKVPGKITHFSIDKTTNSATAEYTLITETREIARLSLDTNAKEFNKKVTLQFFNNSGKLIRTEKDLMLYQYKNIYGSSSVSFPPVNAAKIKIEIQNFSERKEADFRQETRGDNGNRITQHIRNETFDLKGITAYQQIIRSTRGAAIEHPADLPEIHRTKKGNITEIVVSAHRVPCCSVKITADDKNYERTAEISLKNGKKETILAHAVITPAQKGNIILPEQRGDYYVIRIHNGDNAPLKNIRLKWNVKERTLVMIPPEKGDLTLYYGGKAEKQIYDIERYADQFGLPPQIYQLGEETDSPVYAPAILQENFSRYFMWIILAAAAIILFIVIIRMWNKTQDCPDGKQ